MESSPITRNLNLPQAPVGPSNLSVVEEVQEKSIESTKVTAAPNLGDAAPHGGTSGQPGLGEKLDVYAAESAKLESENSAPPAVVPEFPFLFPLGDRQALNVGKPTSPSIDTTA